MVCWFPRISVCGSMLALIMASPPSSKVKGIQDMPHVVTWAYLASFHVSPVRRMLSPSRRHTCISLSGVTALGCYSSVLKSAIPAIRSPEQGPHPFKWESAINSVHVPIEVGKFQSDSSRSNLSFFEILCVKMLPEGILSRLAKKHVINSYCIVAKTPLGPIWR